MPHTHSPCSFPCCKMGIQTRTALAYTFIFSIHHQSISFIVNLISIKASELDTTTEKHFEMSVSLLEQYLKIAYYSDILWRAFIVHR